MKSYNHLYEKTISETNRRYALSQAKHSKRFRKIMKHRHMSDDAAVEQSLDWIVNYENAEHVPVYIYDGITRKERTIIVPTMEELLVQHCIVNAMKPMFCKATISRALDYLESNGFLCRASDHAKRYRSPLRLTEKGQEVGKRIAEKINAVLDTVSHTLTEDERAAFYRSLSAISRSLGAIAQNSEE